MIRSVIQFPHVKTHLVCDALGVIYFNVTHQILAAIAESLRLPQNWKFLFFLELFNRHKFTETEILDDIAAALSEQVDKGGWFARDILRYRELLCALHLRQFDMQMNRAVGVHGRPDCDKRLRELGWASNTQAELFGIKFVLDAEGGIGMRSETVKRQPALAPVFPAFNMFSSCTDGRRKPEHLFLPW
jgi:hypothetical protein